MHHPLHIPLALALTLFPAVSCVRETSRGDAFEASFTLDTETFYDGDEFAFTIRTNRSQFKVVAFEFPLAPDLLESDMVCNTRDGVWSLRERIAVPLSQRGRIRISIRDPETALVKDFSALYTAYASSGVSLIIENEPVSSKYLTAGLPTVIGGDDLVFSLHSRAERLILKDFSCEFNDGTLSVGGEFHFRDRTATVRIPAVRAQDAFSPRILSLSLLDPDTGRDTTVTARYVTAAGFTPGAALTSTRLTEGETATVRFTANRPRFRLTGYAAPSWFVLRDWSEDDPELSLNLEGYASLQTEPLGIDRNSHGVLSFELQDNEYTLRKVIVSVPYSAAVKTAPKDIILSDTDLHLNGEETALVTVSTSTAHSTDLFTARIVSGDRSIAGLYAPAPGENATADEIAPERFAPECEITGGRLLVRAAQGRWGPVTVRVYSKGDEGVFRDISVYVRRDVALRLKGTFADDICWWPDAIDDTFSNLGSGTEGIGWYGMPQGIEAELVTFENRSTRPLTELRRDEVSTWVRCFSLTDAVPSRLEVSFVVSVGSRVTSRFFHGSYEDYDEPKSRLLDGGSADRTVSATLPSSINTTISEASANGSRVSCIRLNRFLGNLDCHADYQHAYGLFLWFRETRHSDDHLGFGTFDVSLSRVTFDRDRYHLLWVMTMFEVLGEWGVTAPWWSELGGERPWIIPFND